VIRHNKICLELSGERADGWRREAGWRNDPNNVCTCEKMNKKIN
jgi:hypothetical protein